MVISRNVFRKKKTHELFVGAAKGFVQLHKDVLLLALPCLA